jgi:RNA polymerase primary sigma factor
MVEMITRWKNTSMDLTYRLGRQPTPREVAAEMDIPERREHIIKRVMRANQSASPAISLDHLLQGTDSIVDRRTPRPDEVVVDTSEAEGLKDLLDQLEERQALILRMRFGMDGHEPKTLKEIGAVIGLTRERVRQIESEALRKLRLLKKRESHL